jgi:hypothetical protein
MQKESQCCLQRKEWKATYKQKDAEGGFVFKRELGREDVAVDMLGSLAMSVEKIHHVETGPNHEDYKHEISNH